MNNKTPINPLVKLGSVKKIETFNIEKIISQYNTLGIDVSRFFKNILELNLYECNQTGYRFFYPFSVVGDAGFYKNLSLNRKNYYPERWEHKKTLGLLNETDNVLEVGSGFGSFLNIMKSNDIKAKGLELNPVAVEKCISYGLDVTEKLIQQESLENKNLYTVVCYFQVLEHITEVYSFIKASVDLLKEDGKLIIGVPNNNPYLFINDKYHTLNLPPHHSGLWNKNSLKSLEKIFSIKLESVNFEPIENTYSQFLSSYIKNSNIFYRKALKAFNKVAPRTLKYLICKFVKGRNILVVFRKTN